MILKNIYNKKIPEIKIPEQWEERNFINSPFIEIPKTVKNGEEMKVVLDLQYPKLGMKNAINRCLIRKEALERLLLACTYIPKGFSFKIWDVYRPWNLQNELYYTYKPVIIKKFKLEKLSIEEQEKVINSYIAIPSKDKSLPPVHTTGGAIDLTIINNKNMEELNFGMGFDTFSELTNTIAFEKDRVDETIKNNRRLLYNIMIEAGFTNLPSELWHFDYGNKNWGYYNKEKVIYEGVFKIDEIKNVISFEEFINALKKENTNISKELKKYQWNYEK